MNKEILLTYTEFAKDHVENIFHVDPAKQPSQGDCRPSQFLRSQFLPATDDGNAAMQHSRCLLQQLPLPLASDQAAFH